MKYFLDTEFDEAQGRITLISIGIVSEDGKHRFYAENADYQPDERTDPWVIENVLPKLRYWGNAHAEVIAAVTRDAMEENLSGGLVDTEDMPGMLRLFFDGETPEFWAYYADYDWVVFMWIFGTMMDKPEKFPYYCRDLKQVLDYHHLDTAWLQQHCPPPAGEHNALVDARWNLQLYQAIDQYLADQAKP
jgi:hypothetical protein